MNSRRDRYVSSKFWGKNKNGRKVSHLPAPAHAQTPPLLDPRSRLGLLNLLHELGHLLGRLLRVRRPREELAQLLLLLLRVRRDDAPCERLAEEEVGHEDAVPVVVVLGAGGGVREDVGALDPLRGEAEDVVDDEDCGGRVGGSRGIAFHAVAAGGGGEVDVFAFWLIVFGDGGGHVTAGFAVVLGAFHGC